MDSNNDNKLITEFLNLLKSHPELKTTLISLLRKAKIKSALRAHLCMRLRKQTNRPRQQKRQGYIN